MIGVLTRKEDHEIVREVFELFKTPWEFFRPEHDYDVVLTMAAQKPSVEFPLIISFGSTPVQGTAESSNSKTTAGIDLLLGGDRLPLYGRCLVFDHSPVELPVADAPGTAAMRKTSRGGIEIRLGFDLFDEFRFLLCNGQPVSNAEIPSLEKHIELLRTLILSAGIELVEIPPIPAGYPFTVCLTHDVDHPLLRNHLVDHTAVGFLYRATIGSVLKALRGRIGPIELLKNFLAAFKFPMVHLGLARDFWNTFDRYLNLEAGLASTFFVIPRRGDPGMSATGRQPGARAASYDVEEIRPQLDRVRERGGEVALHGIDAWIDLGQANEEKARISQISGRSELGVRMHWLRFDNESPTVLDSAGFSYDSTWGYNETVGYRSGTLQVFRPIGAKDLLEIPLHIMDTALFYPSYRDLSRSAAEEVVQKLTADALHFGGVLTINWHDRSLAPERQWDIFYAGMLEELKKLAPWFATASQAAAWFRMRRSSVMEEVRRAGRVVGVRVRVGTDQDVRQELPEMSVRLTRPAEPASSHRSKRDSTLTVVEEKLIRDLDIVFAK